MTDFIKNIYLELYNEHIKFNNYYRTKSLDNFIGNFYACCWSNVVLAYVEQNEIILHTMKQHYLTDPNTYDGADVVNFLKHIDDYEVEILKTIRLRKLKKLLDIQK